MVRWLVVVGIAAGCGDNNATPPPWTSSARYHADLYTADDVTVLRGWYDADLGFDCTTLQLATPGGCPPTVNVFFSDNMCSQPAVIDDDRRMPLTYYQSVGGYFHVTSSTQVSIEEFFVDGTGACRDNHRSAKGYPAEPVEASKFVVRHSDMHDLYGVEFFTLDSDDGSQQIVEVTDGLLVNVPSTGRLEVRETLNGGIAAIASPNPLFDRMLQQDCHPALDAFATYRCAVDSSTAGPPHALTLDSTCASGFTPATLTPGYVIDETLSPTDGIGDLGPLHSHCFDNEPGPWFELDGPTCNMVNASVYVCTTFRSDQFATLDVARE